MDRKRPVIGISAYDVPVAFGRGLLGGLIPGDNRPDEHYDCECYECDHGNALLPYFHIG